MHLRHSLRRGLATATRPAGSPIHHTRTSAMTVAQSQRVCGDTFFLDSFALRQWDPNDTAGTRMTCDQQAFLERVHAVHREGRPLVTGYAPFCRHLFVPNEWGCTTTALPITAANRSLLRSGYTRRRSEELPVLTRWFPAEDVPARPAAYLDIILYSREQLEKEYAELPAADRQGAAQLPNAPWGIISIKAQDEDFETPMQPITMLRNALGREHGGSGVPLDREKYEAAAAFWEQHAVVQ